MRRPSPDSAPAELCHPRTRIPSFVLPSGLWIGSRHEVSHGVGLGLACPAVRMDDPRQGQQEKGRDTCHVHVVPKGTIAEQRDGRPAAVLRGGRSLVSSQPSHCSSRGPRRLTTVPASPTESPEQADSVLSRTPVSRSRWWRCAGPCDPWASVQPGPILSLGSLAYAQRAQFSRPGGVPMATPALRRIAPLTMPSLVPRRSSPAGTPRWPATPLLPLPLALGPVPPNLQMVATDPFFLSPLRPLGHWWPRPAIAPGAWESESAMIKPPGSPALPAPPVALLRSLPSQDSSSSSPFFSHFSVRVAGSFHPHLHCTHSARQSFIYLSTSSPRPTPTSTFLTATPGVIIIASRHRHRFPHSGRHSPIIPTIFRHLASQTLFGHSSNPSLSPPV